MPEDKDIIIAGGGRVGSETAVLLNERGHKIRIIEPVEQLCDQLADEYIATVIQGDASRPSILQQACIQESDVIAALTGNTGLNFGICMAAMKLNEQIKTITRIENPEAEEYKQFVDDVVFPEEAGAKVAANKIIGSDVQSLSGLTGNLDILDIELAEGAPATNKTLQEINFPVGTLVISGAGGDHVARPDTVMEPGKRYIIAVDPDVAEEVMNLLRG